MKLQEVLEIQSSARQLLVENGLPTDQQPTMNILLAEQAGHLQLSATTMRTILAESLMVDARTEACCAFLFEVAETPPAPTVVNPAYIGALAAHQQLELVSA